MRVLTFMLPAVTLLGHLVGLRNLLLGQLLLYFERCHDPIALGAARKFRVRAGFSQQLRIIAFPGMSYNCIYLRAFGNEHPLQALT